MSLKKISSANNKKLSRRDFAKFIATLALTANLLLSDLSFAQDVLAPDNHNKKAKSELVENNDSIEHQKIIQMPIRNILAEYGNDQALDTINKHVLIEINKIRQRNNLHPLKQNKTLTTCAQNYSKYMYTNNRFEHNDKSGVSCRQRIKNIGYPLPETGEVIGKGMFTIAEFMEFTEYSQQHLNQINGSYFFHMGVGYYDGYRTIDLGGIK